jgi:hypothetical protein
MSRAKGGIARANKLTPERKSEIARAGAAARWDDLPQAVCGDPDKPLRIADKEIQCYVLADGTRVLSQAGFLQALGRHRKANVRREAGELPAILQGKAIRPFITDDVIEEARPFAFRTPHGVRASGYRAQSLPKVCEVYLKANDAGVLPHNQKSVAREAEILIRGLATVGIIALVDEVTGYQELRTKDALARILEEFIAKELQAYVQTFPDDFYRQMFRLRGLSYPDDSVRRPQYFGNLTNSIVYERLAPGVLDELKRVTPKSEKGHRKHKFFQLLTANLGYPKLREHLGSVVTLMKLSDGWHDFDEKLNQIHPKYNNTLPLPLTYDPAKDDGRGL